MEPETDLLQFKYTNWHGDEHVYVIAPETQLTYDRHGDDNNSAHWQIHGQVVTRDGEDRPDMEPTRRRSFKLAEISELEAVEAG